MTKQKEQIRQLIQSAQSQNKEFSETFQKKLDTFFQKSNDEPETKFIKTRSFCMQNLYDRAEKASFKFAELSALCISTNLQISQLLISEKSIRPSSDFVLLKDYCLSHYQDMQLLNNENFSCLKEVANIFLQLLKNKQSEIKPETYENIENDISETRNNVISEFFRKSTETTQFYRDSCTQYLFPIYEARLIAHFSDSNKEGKQEETEKEQTKNEEVSQKKEESKKEESKKEETEKKESKKEEAEKKEESKKEESEKKEESKKEETEKKEESEKNSRKEE